MTMTNSFGVILPSDQSLRVHIVCRSGNIIGLWCEKVCSYCPLLRHPIDPFYFDTYHFLLETA